MTFHHRRIIAWLGHYRLASLFKLIPTLVFQLDVGHCSPTGRAPDLLNPTQSPGIGRGSFTGVHSWFLFQIFSARDCTSMQSCAQCVGEALSNVAAAATAKFLAQTLHVRPELGGEFWFGAELSRAAD